MKILNVFIQRERCFEDAAADLARDLRGVVRHGGRRERIQKIVEVVQVILKEIS